MNTEVHNPSSVDYLQGEEADYFDDVSVTLTIGADHFSCSACQLVLPSYDLIEQAGMDTEFDVEGDIDDISQEPEYGND